MIKTLIYRGILSLYMIVPGISYADAVTSPTDFKSFVGLIIGIVNKLVVLVIAITFVVAVWGIVKGWIIQGGSEEGVESGKKVAIAAVVAFVIISSLWGIVYMLKSSIF